MSIPGSSPPGVHRDDRNSLPRAFRWRLAAALWLAVVVWLAGSAGGQALDALSQPRSASLEPDLRPGSSDAIPSGPAMIRALGSDQRQQPARSPLEPVWNGGQLDEFPNGDLLDDPADPSDWIMPNERLAAGIAEYQSVLESPASRSRRPIGAMFHALPGPCWRRESQRPSGPPRVLES